IPSLGTAPVTARQSNPIGSATPDTDREAACPHPAFAQSVRKPDGEAGQTAGLITDRGGSRKANVEESGGGGGAAGGGTANGGRRVGGDDRAPHDAPPLPRSPLNRAPHRYRPALADGRSTAGGGSRYSRTTPSVPGQATCRPSGKKAPRSGPTPPQSNRWIKA